ncbi:hypothetical protein ECANGB1_1620 [Enterospora canceri]|uniref:Signal recognition particle receptor subunit beta n=1 Tax=Enterospora canceri TaxID=1081671 RepID=A0A1Y1S6B4_9MICR|nr:hypothetical protein ECANGB1_1620 [Enterospora canceri]
MIAKLLCYLNHHINSTAISVVFCTILLCIGIHSLLIKKPERKKVFFVGRRESGKTTALLQILLKKKDRRIRAVKRTTPTLIQHSTVINDLEIVEVEQSDEKDVLKKFSINGRDKFIFFLRDDDETYPQLLGNFDIHFVMWKKVKHEPRNDILYLNEDAVALIDLLYKNC